MAVLTLHVASLKMLTAIGLDVGRKAPVFSTRDQFGQLKSLDTLKGPNGRAYGLFNAEAAGFFKGMARPGYFFSLMPQGLSRRSFSNRSIVDGIPGIA